MLEWLTTEAGQQWVGAVGIAAVMVAAFAVGYFWGAGRAGYKRTKAFWDACRERDRIEAQVRTDIEHNAAHAYAALSDACQCLDSPPPCVDVEIGRLPPMRIHLCRPAGGAARSAAPNPIPVAIELPNGLVIGNLPGNSSIAHRSDLPRCYQEPIVFRGCAGVKLPPSGELS